MPYSCSKTLAEKAAWKINGQQSRWDLVVINPSLVLGPALNPKSTQSESLNLLKQLGNGTLKLGVPPIVDVRDVAIAHYRAGFSNKANGRFITNGHNSSFLEIAKIVSEKYGENYPVPKKEIPGWLLMLIGPFVNKALNRKYLKNNLNIPWKADNSKSINILGLTYRTLEETMDESFRVLIDNDMI